MKRYILPRPQFLREMNGAFYFQNPKLNIDTCDMRVQKAVLELCEAYQTAGGESNGKVTISHGNSDKEDYDLNVTESEIKIMASSAAGAFYGVQTLKQLLMQGKIIPCMEVHDCPEFAYRGFYHDVTRGRIPTLDTLKKLVDKAAFYKINSLQLYVEHTFAFREYASINEGQEPLTPEDIRELDAYCRERFIDLVPSLSCFGHLYALLQSPEYCHLCELEDYEPKAHLWRERMLHHTIDVSADESFALICSLIDQYLPLFSSPYFNICCDETMDLGKGRNKGKDPGRLYTDFLKKIIAYVETQGKTVMFWGDIVLEHIDFLPEISNQALLLNWEYSDEPNFSKIKCFEEAGRTQIVCPGTSGWGRLVENSVYGAKNIRSMAMYAKVCHALGVLNTNWGDNGHLCDPQNAAYGMILGAVESWNPGAADEAYFDRAVGILNYHNDNGNVVKALKMLNQSDEIRICNRMINLYGVKNYSGYVFDREQYGWEDLTVRMRRCRRAGKILETELKDGNLEQDTGRALILAAKGYTVILKGLAIVCGSGKFGGKNLCEENFSEETFCQEFCSWLEQFQENWKRQNRRDELSVAVDVMEGFCRAVQEEMTFTKKA